MYNILLCFAPAISQYTYLFYLIARNFFSSCCCFFIEFRSLHFRAAHVKHTFFSLCILWCFRRAQFMKYNFFHLVGCCECVSTTGCLCCCRNRFQMGSQLMPPLSLSSLVLFPACNFSRFPLLL